MSRALEDFNRITQLSTEIMVAQAKLERDNATLKRAMCILMESVAMGEDGKYSMEMSREDADFVKMAVDSCNVTSQSGEKHKQIFN